MHHKSKNRIEQEREREIEIVLSSIDREHWEEEEEEEEENLIETIIHQRRRKTSAYVHASMIVFFACLFRDVEKEKEKQHKLKTSLTRSFESSIDKKKDQRETDSIWLKKPTTREKERERKKEIHRSRLWTRYFFSIVRDRRIIIVVIIIVTTTCLRSIGWWSIH